MKLFLVLTLIGVAVALPVEHKSQPWVTSGYFEGDIKLTEDQKNGITNTNQRWTNRIMPYTISSSFSASERNTIQQAIDWYNANTCVQLVARTSQTNYVSIGNGFSGCYAYVGMIGGAQELNLQSNGCVYHATIVHELLHALGFYHQQSATNRDDFVTIQLQNVISGQEHNFDKYAANFITDFGVPYDYGSVMHYGAWDFSSNGEKTIVTHDANAVIGQAPTLSASDVLKLNTMYGC